jgi:cyclic beta-1,2-glucan synthetase
MRLISTVDWAEFFESVSPVDALLRGRSDFAAMDFATRDLYRRRIERLSRQSRYNELEVAGRLADATAPPAATDEPQKRDPGYFLLAEGQRGFERALGCRIGLRLRLSRLICDMGIGGYAGILAAFTMLLLFVVLSAVGHVGVTAWQLALLAVVGCIPASDVAMAITNRLVSELVDATPLPSLELRDGIRS